MEIKLELSCPKCKSEQTQKITAIVASGTTHSVGKTSTVGVATAGRGIGVGTASSTTRSTSKTALASKLAAPTKKFQNLYLVFIPALIFAGWIPYNIASSIFGEGFFGTLMGFAALGGAGYLLFMYLKKKADTGKEYNTNVFPKEMQDWENGFFCHRCEHVFVPAFD